MADSAAGGQGSSDLGSAPAPAARTAGEHRAELDRKLGESLQDFDESLLREKEILAERSGNSGSYGGGAGGGSAGGGASGGSSGGGASGGGGGGGGGNKAGNEAAEGQNAGGSQGSTPADIPDGSDDDIVARQLREAAMNEDDPELRDKLWDEYRKYKSGGVSRTKDKSKGKKN